MPSEQMRLLLVEDEPDLVTGLVRALRKEGYAVDTADDGEEGRYKAVSTAYDVIILDVMLPRLSGWDILSAIRKEKTTPVLMLTARDSTTDRVRGLDAGADDYLIKPFDVTELLARLRALIRRQANQPQTILEIGDLRIDTKSREVSVANQNIILTAREYAVIEYLMIHRGEVISRSTLYDRLFDENDDTLSNVIDVHIFNLRKKLGRDYILTRRGHGYVIP